MSKDTSAGDVRGLDGIRISILIRDQHVDKLMGQMGVRATMPCSLSKGQVIFSGIATVNSSGSKGGNFFRK